MTLDPRIRDAIVEASDEQGQGPGLADKLVAWVDALAKGNEVLSDRDSVHRHLELLYDATTTDIQDEATNGDA